MGDELGQILWLQRVQHVEKVGTRWPLTCRELIWKVADELRIFCHKWPDGFHRQLIVGWDGYVLDGRLLQQQLLTGHDGFKEIFVDDWLVWQVVLQATGWSVGKWAFTYCWSR